MELASYTMPQWNQEQVRRTELLAAGGPLGPGRTGSGSPLDLQGLTATLHRPPPLLFLPLYLLQTPGPLAASDPPNCLCCSASAAAAARCYRPVIHTQRPESPSLTDRFPPWSPMQHCFSFNPLDTTSRGLNPQGPDPQWYDPQRPDPQWPDPQRPDPQWPDPQRPDPQWPDPQRPDPLGPDLQGPDPQWPDPQRPDPQWPDPQRTDPQWPDPQGPDPLGPHHSATADKLLKDGQMSSGSPGAGGGGGITGSGSIAAEWAEPAAATSLSLDVQLGDTVPPPQKKDFSPVHIVPAQSAENFRINLLQQSRCPPEPGLEKPPEAVYRGMVQEETGPDPEGLLGTLPSIMVDDDSILAAWDALTDQNPETRTTSTQTEVHMADLDLLVQELTERKEEKRRRRSCPVGGACECVGRVLMALQHVICTQRRYLHSPPLAEGGETSDVVPLNPFVRVLDRFQTNYQQQQLQEVLGGVSMEILTYPHLPHYPQMMENRRRGRDEGSPDCQHTDREPEKVKEEEKREKVISVYNHRQQEKERRLYAIEEDTSAETWFDAEEDLQPVLTLAEGAELEGQGRGRKANQGDIEELHPLIY